MLHNHLMTPKVNMVYTQPGQSPLVNFFHPTQWAPVWYSVMEALDKASLIRLAQTSQTIRYWIISASGLWDINKPLQRFFEDPIAFRSQLGACDAIMSGGFALRFFEHFLRGNVGLNIYVQQGRKSEALHQHLTCVAGYVLGSRNESPESKRENLFEITQVSRCGIFSAQRTATG